MTVVYDLLVDVEFRDGEWTDLSDRVRDHTIAIRRGRQGPTRTQPGTLKQLQLDNRDGALDANNTASIYCITHLDLPGSGAAYATTPDHASLDITGDLEIVWHGSLDDWTPAARTALVAKMVAGATTGGYALFVNTGGTLRLEWSTGAANLAKDSTVAVSATNGDTRWIKVTLDVNNGAAGNDVKFYTSTDTTDIPADVTWTQLGTTVTTAGTTSIGGNSSALRVGADPSGGALLAGNVWTAVLRNGIAGSIVANPDFGFGIGSAATSVTDDLGRVWSLNGTADIAFDRTQVIPGRSIRVRADFAGLIYPLFLGTVDDWPLDGIERWADSVVTVNATDGFRQLALAETAESVWALVADTSTLARWLRLNETDKAAILTDSSGNNQHGTYAKEFFTHQGLILGSSDRGVGWVSSLATSGGSVPAVTGGATAFGIWVRFSNTTGAVTLLDEKVTGREIVIRACVTAAKIDVVHDDGVNETTHLANTTTLVEGTTYLIVVQMFLGTPLIYINGTLQSTSTSAVGSSISATNVMRICPAVLQDVEVDEVCAWTATVDASALYTAGSVAWRGDGIDTRVGRLLTAAGWPLADRSIGTTGYTLAHAELANRKVLDVLRECEAAEIGEAWITAAGIYRFQNRDYAPAVSYAFSDTAGSTLHYEDAQPDSGFALVVNEVTFDTGQHKVTARDTTSISRYTGGVPVSRTIRAPLADPDDTAAQAAYALALMKDPRTRLKRLTVDATTSSTMGLAVAQIDLGTRITVEIHPQGGHTVTVDAYVAGIEHHLALNKWRTHYYVAPRQAVG